MKVGILSLQGCIEPHVSMLKRLDLDPLKVKSANDLDKISHLIMPGGESTTMLKLLHKNDIFNPLKEFVKSMPTWGICAGAILLAEKVSHPEQESLEAISIHAVRNYYGSQLDSFETRLNIAELGKEGSHNLAVQFIRAPLFKTLNSKVKILAEHNKQPVLISENKVLVSAFHTELGEDTWLHTYFLGSGW